MKIILLAATGGEPISRGFPLWSSKPKHLYHYGGEIVLEQLINRLFEAGFEQEDIEIVVGFKYQKIIDFLKEKNFDIKAKINYKWKKSVVYTLRTAIEGIDKEDFVLMYADDIRKVDFYRRLISHKHGVLVCGGGYGFGGKFSKEYVPVIKRILDRYQNVTKIKYGVGKECLDMNSGIAMTAIFSKIEEELQEHHGYDPKESDVEWLYFIDDCDTFFETDEYKNCHVSLRVAYFILFCFTYLASFRFVHFSKKAPFITLKSFKTILCSAMKWRFSK